MTLDPVFLQKFQKDLWFQNHTAAWAIVRDGPQQIASTKTANSNLQCLLSNMCRYGRSRPWRYEPGGPTNVENTLRGTCFITDCKGLARIFCEIGEHLGYEGIEPYEIKRDGYRIVTKPGLVTFNGESGYESLEDRWCFGDHWIAVYRSLCYDPTFKFQGFNFQQVPAVYVGWYARDVRDAQFFTGTVWS